MAEYKLRALLRSDVPATLTLAETILSSSPPCTGAAVLQELLLSLGVSDDAARPAFTEAEALSIIVRLLGTLVGDATGDELDKLTFAFPAGPGREIETEEVANAKGGTLAAAQRRAAGLIAPTLLAMGSGGAMVDFDSSGVAASLCSERAVLAVIDLIRRRAVDFERGDDPYLRQEALRALRLQLMPLPLVVGCSPTLLAEAMAAGAGGVVRHTAVPAGAWWWIEEDIGYVTRGMERRFVVEVVMRALQGLTAAGTHMGHKPRGAAICCLWSLVSTSAACRTRAFQLGACELVVELLKLHIKEAGSLPIEAPFIALCGLLVALGGGPRLHERRLVELEADTLALALMDRFLQHRQVAAGAFVLLGVVCRDPTAAARLQESKEKMAVLDSARNRWPDALDEAARCSTQQLASIVQKSSITRQSAKGQATEERVSSSRAVVRSSSRRDRYGGGSCRSMSSSMRSGASTGSRGAQCRALGVTPRNM